MASAFLRHDSVSREVSTQALHHQFFAGPVGFGHEVEIAFQFEGDAPLKIMGQQSAGFARNLDRCLQVCHALCFFRDVFDVVFENEKVGIPFSGEANEGLVVVFDHADYFFSIFQFDPDRRRMLDQLFEIPGLFKRLFRGACGLCRGWRSGFS